MAIYKTSSPWKDTPIENNYLTIFKIRPVSSEPDDFLYTTLPAVIGTAVLVVIIGFSLKKALED